MVWLVAAIVVVAYVGLRVGLRALAARHDRPWWRPLAAARATGRVDETLLAETLPHLVHPAARTSAAVALAHLRVDRGDWDGARMCLGRMSPLHRALLGSLIPSPGADPDDSAAHNGGDGDGVPWAGRLLAARSRTARLTRRPTDLAGETLFCAQAAALRRGQPRRAFALGRRAWAARPSPVTAYNCACAAARAGQVDDALEWLDRAVAGGYPTSELAADEDLAPLRGTEAFANLTRRRSSPLPD